MKLSRNEITGLLGLIESSQLDEIDCDDCLVHIAEFADLELANKDLPEALEVVGRHLEQCDCCREEYKLLLEGLATLEQADTSQSEN